MNSLRCIGVGPFIRMVNSDWFKRFVCYTLSFHLAVGPVFSLPITVDPTQDQTYVDSAVNDVPIVYISAPDDNGLSQNKFTDYNVGSDGVIINNSVVCMLASWAS